MSQPYLGQIESFPYSFAPKGWATCSGQLLAIQQNTALFSLLGTTYGGDGIRTFALPDLRGRVAIGQGNGGGLTPRVIGETDGEVSHTLLYNEMPIHIHTLNAAPTGAVANNVDTPGPTVVLGTATGVQGTTPLTVNPYAASTPTVPMAAAAIGTNPGSQPHNNMMPYLGMDFCIALSGIFPSRN